MCGIAGILSLDAVDVKAVQAMADKIIHRGPDGYGYLFSESSADNLDCPHSQYVQFDAFQVGLAHRRLSIHDLTMAGRQPMLYMNRYWIVFNGEIYNFIELKAELKQQGYEFHSHTDTEIILAAYDYWGTECFNKFNGMWALVLIDTTTQEIIISRDRFGIKPLYYYNDEKSFVFASEIKALLVYPGVPKEPNLSWIKHYLEIGPQEHTRDTAFEGIYRFDFASYFKGSIKQLLTASSESTKRYWQGIPNTNSERFDVSKLALYTGKYRQLLEDAVKLRLRSDVKVGSALSGGLDSSSIVSLVNKLHKADNIEGMQETFSSVYKTKGTEDCDESKFIDEVAKDLNVKSHQIEPDSEQILVEHKKMIYHLDNPPENTLMSSWYTFKLVSDSDVTVTLDGQGADEQLAGYLGYYLTYFSLASFKEIIQGFKEFVKVPAIKKHFIVGVGANLLSRLLGKKLVSKAYRAIGRKEPLFMPLNQRLYHDLSTSLVTLLHYADATSMAYSIESRMPFMDYRLVEQLLSTPDVYKLHAGWTKYLARVAIADILPSNITWRKDKLGWPIPEKVWFQGTHKKYFTSIIKNSAFLHKYSKSLGLQGNHMTGSFKKQLKLFNLTVWYGIFWNE